MKKRLDIIATQPEAYKTMSAMENYVNNAISDATYQRAAELFDETYLAQIIMTIVTINAWNRLAITGQKPLPKVSED